MQDKNTHRKYYVCLYGGYLLYRIVYANTHYKKSLLLSVQNSSYVINGLMITVEHMNPVLHYTLFNLTDSICLRCDSWD